MSDQLGLDLRTPVQKRLDEARAVIRPMNHKRRSQRRCRQLKAWSEHVHAVLDDGAAAILAMQRRSR